MNGYKKIVLIAPWPLFLDVYFYKDVGTFIKYLSYIYKRPAEIVMLKNFSPEFTKKNNFEGVKIVKIENTSGYEEVPKLRNIIKYSKYLKPFKYYIKENAKEMGHVMLFHLNSVTLTFTKWLTHYNKDIKIYVKGDISFFNRDSQKFLLAALLKKGIYFSCESKELYNKICLKNKKYNKQICLIPNGVDDTFALIIPHQRKDNLIISTARFGSTQKNSELLLDILANLDYKRDWQVILAGPIETEEQDFQLKIDDCFRKNPNLEKHVHFIGNVSDRNELYKLYERAKIFIFPSRWEGSSLSFIEAAYFGNYIIATDVGCAKEVLSISNYGFIAPESQTGKQNITVIKDSMVKELQSIINGSKNIEIERENFINKIRNNYSMTRIVSNDFFKSYMQ